MRNLFEGAGCSEYRSAAVQRKNNPDNALQDGEMR